LNVIEKDQQAKKKSYVNSGTLSVQNARIERHASLTDFIAGGLEISLAVAIDFTGSNGHPQEPSSLHYISPGGMQHNQYEQAILAIGSVLEPYDSDRMYPVYGFGAKVILPDGSQSAVQHCFPVYGGGLEVQGVSGIHQAYRDALGHVALSGPTLFGPIISASCAFAAASNCSQERQKYHVLLILTDGEINDMRIAIDAIVQAAKLPMSIIIVGVGSADFSSMKALDGDGGPLKSAAGEPACRDIVQFVSFREFAAKGASMLAQEVLAEIPSQLLKHMAARGITPNPKTRVVA